MSLVDIVRGLNILYARGWSISSLKSLAAAFRLADSRKGFALCMPASLKRAAVTATKGEAWNFILFYFI